MFDDWAVARDRCKGGNKIPPFCFKLMCNNSHIAACARVGRLAQYNIGARQPQRATCSYPSGLIKNLSGKMSSVRKNHSSKAAVSTASTIGYKTGEQAR
jgi:hypothetical protein